MCCQCVTCDSPVWVEKSTIDGKASSKWSISFTQIVESESLGKIFAKESLERKFDFRLGIIPNQIQAYGYN